MVNFVGYNTFNFVDDNGIELKMAVMFPTNSTEASHSIGPYSISAALDAEPIKDKFPLVVISHGSGGSSILYRTIAHSLASNGFIVGMLEHPFNNRLENSGEGTIKNLINRPYHLQVAINWFYSSSKFGALLKPDNVVIIGHSLGGYSALAIAGGTPTARAHESVDNVSHKLDVVHDKRVRALVLLAPATIWFNQAHALDKVHCPILAYVGENDEYTGPTCPILLASGKKNECMPFGYHIKLILDGVPEINKVEVRLIKNAGHFSFLSPFPTHMIKKSLAPTQDPIGFNRVEFHKKLNYEILEFLTQNTR